ncbi:MAG: hypothetical protein V2I48_00195 [Xanthomonadales bacterium]|jgi:glycosyltransferase involved in cell wall biosynthesis|nr:hypothetical protein [Xanthomonadales bacterium]
MKTTKTDFVARPQGKVGEKIIGQITLIHPEGNFNNNPHLSTVIEMLCESGCHIDIHALRRKCFQGSPHPDAQVNMPNKYLVRMVLILSRFYWGHFFAYLLCRLQFSRIQSGLIIGVDADGAVIASILGNIYQIPTALFSYEIFASSEIGELRKAPEIRACQDIEFAVVQDRKRGEILSKENEIDPGKLIYMPVAARRSLSTTPGWLRKELKIGREKKIALFIGSLEKWSGFDRVLDTLPLWPSDWCLVVHDRYGMSGAEVSRYSQKSTGNLFFSTRSFSTNDELARIMGDADLGIALYCPDYETPYTGLNIENIGLSSGKIATFLRFGVPVLVNQIGEMADLIVSDELGYLVCSPEEISTVLKNAGKKEVEAIERCRSFFDSHLSVESTWVDFFGRVKQVLRQ